MGWTLSARNIDKPRLRSKQIGSWRRCRDKSENLTQWFAERDICWAGCGEGEEDSSGSSWLLIRQAPPVMSAKSADIHSNPRRLAELNFGTEHKPNIGQEVWCPPLRSQHPYTGAHGGPGSRPVAALNFWAVDGASTLSSFTYLLYWDQLFWFLQPPLVLTQYVGNQIWVRIPAAEVKLLPALIPHESLSFVEPESWVVQIERGLNKMIYTTHNLLFCTALLHCFDDCMWGIQQTKCIDNPSNLPSLPPIKPEKSWV